MQLVTDAQPANTGEVLLPCYRVTHPVPLLSRILSIWQWQQNKRSASVSPSLLCKRTS